MLAIGRQFAIILLLFWAGPLLLAQETVSILLQPGDDEALLHRLMTHSGVGRGGPSPIIITLEPGPLELAGGLRILAAEMPPNLTMPDRLIVSAGTDTQLPDTFLAFMRRCLMQKIPVWVVGDEFPASVADFHMQPGWIIERIPPAGLAQRLDDLCEEIDLPDQE